VASNKIKVLRDQRQSPKSPGSVSAGQRANQNELKTA
jgi:hypothetical protein